MTTTDTEALTERIADALTDHWKRKHSTLLTSGPCSGCSRAAADAVAVEVRKAKADALDEFAQWAESLNDKHPRFKAANDLAADMAKRFKADNYETGDSDDRR